jgi:hypothetical protein
MIGRQYSVDFFIGFIGTRDRRLSEFVLRNTDGFNWVFYVSNCRIRALKILAERIFLNQVISQIKNKAIIYAENLERT